MSFFVRLTLIIALVCIGTAWADSGIPDLGNSIWTHELDAPAGMCVCPAGDGHAFTEMRNADGPVDGTIMLTMLDSLNRPIWLFPNEDIWLEAPGLESCPGGTIADAHTDQQGRTWFTFPPRFSGIQTGPLDVFINGDRVWNRPTDMHRLMSPDLDGNGSVNISDVIMFVIRWDSGVYDPAIDYYFDGLLNISDLVTFADHLNHQCP